MKIHYLPLALAAGLVMHLTSPATAAPTDLRSPKTAQTYADATILWHQLRWLPDAHQLIATITFSNVDYVSGIEPQHNRTCNFPLPGVTPGKNGVFYSSGVAVAKMHTAFIGHSVELLPNARLVVTNHDGRVGVRLLSNQPVTDGPLWVQR